MSTRKSINVTRSYEHEPDRCARALELLLKTSVRKEGTRPGAPDDVKGIENASRHTNFTK